ncbi:unnamed protein product [Clavelina lepadiformis]|uniref:Uncharacterized protein n=1 Tax=Clavelina lepadiformis TaxID=159417 RepID=A0ABP0H1G0_CLALP
MFVLSVSPALILLYTAVVINAKKMTCNEFQRKIQPLLVSAKLAEKKILENDYENSHDTRKLQNMALRRSLNLFESQCKIIKQLRSCENTQHTRQLQGIQTTVPANIANGKDRSKLEDICNLYIQDIVIKIKHMLKIYDPNTHYISWNTSNGNRNGCTENPATIDRYIEKRVGKIKKGLHQLLKICLAKQRTICSSSDMTTTSRRRLY